MQNNAYWQSETETECIQHVEVFPDYVNYAVLSLNLSPVSRSWIVNDLAKAYPGASLKRPDWQFTFPGPGVQGDDETVFWAQLVPNIQLADPGVYNLRLTGRTTGTLVSTPRSFDLPLEPFQVDLLRVALIEAP